MLYVIFMISRFRSSNILYKSYTYASNLKPSFAFCHGLPIMKMVVMIILIWYFHTFWPECQLHFEPDAIGEIFSDWSFVIGGRPYITII